MKKASLEEELNAAYEVAKGIAPKMPVTPMFIAVMPDGKRQIFAMEWRTDVEKYSIASKIVKKFQANPPDKYIYITEAHMAYVDTEKEDITAPVRDRLDAQDCILIVAESADDLISVTQPLVRGKDDTVWGEKIIIRGKSSNLHHLFGGIFNAPKK